MRCEFEIVESRCLMTAAFSVAVNFQPLAAHRPPGMFVDYGTTYGVHRGGLSYGWNQDMTAQTVERNVTKVQKNDTFIAMPTGGQWNVGLANGEYKVYVVAGEPAKTGDRMALTVEGQTAIAGITRKSKPFLEAALTVTVTDGKLTIASAGTFGADKINYVGIVSTSMTPTVPAGTLRWTQAASAPLPRIEGETATVNNQMYVFSGYADANYQPSKRVDRYDPATNIWTRMADMPVATNHTAVAAVGTDIWLAGGYYARPGTIDKQNIGTTSVWIYHTATNTWSSGPALPAKRGAGGLALIGRTLYFTGGETTDRSDRGDTWALKLDNQAAGWISRAPLPSPRGHFGTAVVNGKMYIMAGWIGNDATATILKTAYSYDPVQNRWQQLADLPAARSHLSPATVAVGTKIYMFGGELHFNVQTNELLVYDTLTGTYSNLTPLPAVRSAGDASYINGRFIFTCGKANGFQAETYVGTFI